MQEQCAATVGRRFKPAFDGVVGERLITKRVFRGERWGLNRIVSRTGLADLLEGGIREEKEKKKERQTRLASADG